MEPNGTTGSGTATSARTGQVPEAKERDERRPGGPGAQEERSHDERASPTRLPGIPGHGMTSNMSEDPD